MAKMTAYEKAMLELAAETLVVEKAKLAQLEKIAFSLRGINVDGINIYGVSK